MEISKEQEEIEETIEMPNVTGLTYIEAKKILKELDINCNELSGEDVVTDQIPKKGIQITKGKTVILYGTSQEN